MKFVAVKHCRWITQPLSGLPTMIDFSSPFAALYFYTLTLLDYQMYILKFVLTSWVSSQFFWGNLPPSRKTGKYISNWRLERDLAEAHSRRNLYYHHVR